jgi:UDP-glucuronate 4-epimerase
LRILVTGGAGFIGSNLVKHLLDNNHEIVVIDNFHPYYSKQRKLFQLDDAKRKGSFEFKELDLTNILEVKNFFDNNTFDTIVHLAALPGVSYSITSPNEYIMNNVLATNNILQSIKNNPNTHFIFASSSSVYGNKGNRPLSEDDVDLSVVSPYAASKLSCEIYCKCYSEMYNLKTTTLRFFTVYGPFVRPDMAISKFIKLATAGEELKIYGYDTMRDFTYISDIIDGICKVIESKTTGTFNLGSSSPIKLRNLVEILNEQFPNLKVRIEDLPLGDVNGTFANISRAKNELGYEPRVNFNEGLFKTIQWAKDNQNLL